MKDISFKLFSAVVILTFCLSCCSVYGATYDITAWFDNFERNSTCNGLIKDKIPSFDYGQQNGWYRKWGVWGEGGSAHTKVECTTVCNGTRAMRTEFNIDDMPEGGGPISLPTYPFVLPHPGSINIYEHDVFIPTGSEAEMAIRGATDAPSPAGWYAVGGSGEMWRYRVENVDPCSGIRYAKSDVPVQADTWNHVRLETYHDDSMDASTFSMWVTPQGGSETLVVENAPSPAGSVVGVGVHRGQYLSRKNGTNVYWDNVHIWWIDEEAQGYPIIGIAPSGMVIDGHIGTSEWAGVTKVAEKPLGSNGSTGDFEPFWHRDYNPKQDPNVAIDVYAAYDSNNFYIAGRFNKALYGQADGSCSAGEVGCNALFEAVFVYDTRPYNDSNDYLNDREYVFRCVAKSSQATDQNDLVAIRLTSSGYYTAPPISPFTVSSKSCVKDTTFSYSNVKSTGGQMSYSVTGNLMDVEMKIPFAAMPEFAGCVPGGKVVLQFNVSCPTDGWVYNRQGLVTTNINTERFPWERAWISEFIPYGAGVTFPLAGDYNGDGIVNFLDFADFAKNWMQSSVIFNLTGSSVIDMKDMEVFSQNWLQKLIVE